MKDEQKIIIYKAKGGESSLQVSLKDETIWLTQKQIAGLFGTQRPAITKHLNNIFKARELSRNSVCSLLEHTAADGKKYKANYYNLDAIISVGYRVNSSKATHFRIWATGVLKNYLVKGYALNQKRLNDAKLKDFDKTVKLFKNIIARKKLDLRESEGLLRVITDYADSWSILQRYDEGSLKLSVWSKGGLKIDYEKTIEEIASLKSDLIRKKQATKIFGLERDQGLKGIIGNIHQTFGNKELYPSLEEKAAYLLYFIIKDHPFVDGNKRIASFLFVLFLMKNKFLYQKDGEKKFNTNALVALALLVAESRPKDKDVMIDLIINFVAGK